MATIGDLHEEAGVGILHLQGHKPIKGFKCTKCHSIFQVKDDTLPKGVDAEPSLGTWGPNGNGWLYWHKKDGGAMLLIA